MRILINCSNLIVGGGIQVAHSFISFLKEEKDEFFIVLSKPLAQQIDQKSFPSNIHFYDYTIKPTIFKAFSGKNKLLSKICKDELVDVVFTVFGPAFWNPSVPHLTGFARPRYIYKESPYFDTINLKRRIKFYLKELTDIINFRKFSDALVTESWDASERLGERIKGKKIYTVTNNYNQVFDYPESWDYSIKMADFNGITLLSISSYYTHKNFEIIPGIIAYLKANHPLLKFRFALTFDKNYMPNISDDVSDHILFLGKVNILQCPPLYLQSTIMFQPSLLECFSASYPEAMKMGVPILAADLGFAHGICGDAAHYYSPISAESAGKAIYELAQNNELRSNLIEKGKERLMEFDTAKSRATKYIDILKTLSSKKSLLKDKSDKNGDF